MIISIPNRRKLIERRKGQERENILSKRDYQKILMILSRKKKMNFIILFEEKLLKNMEIMRRLLNRILNQLRLKRRLIQLNLKLSLLQRIELKARKRTEHPQLTNQSQTRKSSTLMRINHLMKMRFRRKK